eukprot:4914244-Alexandrium_andersonii.AAC.1
MDREFSKGAVLLRLRRDASHGRLLLTYTATAPDLTTREGIFWQCKKFGTGAAQIVNATQNARSRLCTPG